MNYTIGDSVVCIDATDVSGETRLVAGHQYLVIDIGTSPCCGKEIVKIAGRTQQVFSKCPCGGGLFGAWNAAWRFIKLDAIEVSHSGSVHLESEGQHA